MASISGRGTHGLSGGECRTEGIAKNHWETEESEIESVSASSKGPKPKKCCSNVWKVFSKMPGGKKVLCVLCKNGYSYLGATSNMREHLLCHHKDKYKRNESLLVVSALCHVPERLLNW